jgi:glucose/arabinose dehydrogenase
MQPKRQIAKRGTWKFSDMNQFISRPSIFKLIFTLIFLIAGFEPIAPAYAGTPQDAGFTELPYLTPGGVVTSIAWAPDGSNRLFMTIKSGAVKIAQNGTILPTNFATFSPYTSSECGVLALAFDPNYISNKYVYIFYTVSSSVQRIVRMTDSGNIGTNLTTIVDNLPTLGSNHDGGAMTIGADHNGAGSYLYWGVGNNGANVGEGLNFTTLASKVGRANLDGSAPNDNPYYNATDGVGPTDYIWALGFRNPFTMNFQTNPKKLWVNVVGDSYEQIFQVNRGDYVGDRYNENRQPAGAAPSVSPKIKYRTNNMETFNLAAAPNGAQRSVGVATFTTTGSSHLKQGEKITIAGVADTSFNGTFYVTSVSAANRFTVAMAGTSASSGGGTVSTTNLGGCVTGGSFYYGTLFPAQYRKNFFWGDCNSGNIMRATLDGSNNVTQVDLFLAAAESTIDTAPGPDGNLYYATGTGKVMRVVYTPPAQALLVSPTELSTIEGMTNSFSVRLATAPASNVTVNVARASGDTSASVSQGATLTFTPSNYSVPQGVILAAAEDSDTASGSAVFNISSAGLTTQQVNLAISDNDPLSLVLSKNSLSINEGQSGTFTVSLTSAPPTDVTVTVARTSGDTSASVTGGGSLLFTPSHYSTPQTVTIAAAQDGDTVNSTATFLVSSSAAAARTFPVTINDDDAPAPVITSTALTTAVQGAPYRYDVQATGSPAPTYALSTAPSGMTINSTSGLISWTPASTGSFGVTVQASNGTTPIASQSFTVTVSADQVPTCRLTKPQPGSTSTGVDAEFFGDAFDDVGTIKAEFYIDNQLAYTDINDQEHYHINGAHLLWDTTRLSNGSHLMRMTVYDTAGHSASCEVSANVSNSSGAPTSPRNVKVENR